MVVRRTTKREPHDPRGKSTMKAEDIGPQMNAEYADSLIGVLCVHLRRMVFRLRGAARPELN
jgi:hypothetical protein